jgi:putative ATP-dependent endonuclease of the OLD family
VHSLIGVHIDAFKENDSSAAEMDVDNFLVEANGAGIREVLKIVSDLELQKPELLLIEEPEVHLHPGLARLVASHLRKKANSIQTFVTTHSTEFIDSVTFENAYLIRKNASGYSECQLIKAESEALLIPAELGLRLSTVFMFDNLVFVEGPSDEGVLRALAQTLELDLTNASVGFVHMGGIKNFAHYAAESTLSLLSRRQVKMWFLADRDEMTNEEVQRMAEKLGERASFHVLERRELENYLLEPSAIAELINCKCQAGTTPQIIQERLHAHVHEAKEEVIRLHLQKELLSPIYLRSRKVDGNVAERLEGAMEEIRLRQESLERLDTSVRRSIEERWAADGFKMAPGAFVLERLFREFGLTYSKGKGDSERLAQRVQRTHIPMEIAQLIRQISNRSSVSTVGA